MVKMKFEDIPRYVRVYLEPGDIPSVGQTFITQINENTFLAGTIVELEMNKNKSMIVMLNKCIITRESTQLGKLNISL